MKPIYYIKDQKQKALIMVLIALFTLLFNNLRVFNIGIFLPIIGGFFIWYLFFYFLKKREFDFVTISTVALTFIIIAAKIYQQQAV